MWVRSSSVAHIAGWDNLLFLLDANVLIDANRDYYPLERVPEYWTWLVDRGRNGRVKIPRQMYGEVLAGKGDALTTWVRDNRRDLMLDEEVLEENVAQVVEEGYATNLMEVSADKLGQDPFLIAYTLADPLNRTVVTTEVSKPGKKGVNRHVPDVCRTFGVQCCDAFDLIVALAFSTDWRRRK